MPAEPPVTGETKHQRLTELFPVYRNYLNHEHNLINNRLGWNFTIQGFLFTAYALATNQMAQIRIALSHVQTLRGETLLEALSEMQFLVIVIAGTGVVSSICVWLSVRGAQRTMNRLRDDWRETKCEGEKLESLRLSSGYPGILAGGDDLARDLGFHAPNVLSIAMAIAWGILLWKQLV